MRTSVRLTIAASVAAGLMSVGAPAFADSAGNNGINVLDDDNLSVLPIQVCNSGTTDLLAIPLHLLSDNEGNSPHDVDCTNAPILDHP